MSCLCIAANYVDVSIGMKGEGFHFLFFAYSLLIVNTSFTHSCMGWASDGLTTAQDWRIGFHSI